MYNINYFSLLTMLIVNSLFALLFYNKLHGIKRIYFMFSVVSVLIYSGLGISIVANDFFSHYLIFSTTFIFTLYFVMRDKKKKENKGEFFNEISFLLQKRSIFAWFVNAGTLLFLLTYFVFLLYPEVRINHLWNPVSSSLVGIFERQASQQSNTILNMANSIKTVLLPLFMIKLYVWKLRGKIVKGLSFILLWLYLDYLSILYIGRYEMVVSMIFIVFYIFADSRTLSLKKKHYIIIGVGLIASLPMLASYQFYRLGVSAGDISFADSLGILSKEILFPRFYEIAKDIAKFVSPIRYFLWFLVLPIPFISDKSSICLLVNRTFSEYILGIEYGAKGYYVLLPSILGEAIIIYNEYFYWIHAVFLAVLVGSLCKLLLKNRELGVLNLYFSARIIAIGRGGSQGFFGLAVNSLIVYLLIKCIAKSLRARRISHTVIKAEGRTVT